MDLGRLMVALVVGWAGLSCGGSTTTGLGALRITWTINGNAPCPGGSAVTVRLSRGTLSTTATAACDAGEIAIADLPTAVPFQVEVVLTGSGEPVREARPAETPTVSVVPGKTTELAVDIVCGPALCLGNPCLPGAPSVAVAIASGSSVPGCEESGNCYYPSTARIAVGATITWSNDDTAAHTVTAGTPAEGPSGTFDSSLLMAGTTFEHRFAESGTFHYFCMVHPWMTGSVEVVRCD